MDEDTLTVAEHLASSMLDARNRRHETVFPEITHTHECHARWSSVLTTLTGMLSIPTVAENPSPPVLLSTNTAHPTPDLHLHLLE